MPTDNKIMIHSIPYPYKAMVAICSDLDETPNQATYFETIKYLNTCEKTRFGRGLGIETGNTIYFNMPPDQFSYWNTDDKGREKIRTLIKSGHIDCLHSFGDLAKTRKHAARNINELTKHNCHMQVWIDHGTAPTNFDAGIMCGQGDLPGSEAYHADITCDYGIKYVWKGRVTSIIGQNCPKNLSGIWNSFHPYQSSKTISKEVLKGFLAKLNYKKYAMHNQNQVAKEIQLRDGRIVQEFMRSNPYWGGVGLSATADGLGEVITEKMLTTLINKHGFCVFYTHLGRIYNEKNIFTERTKKSLKLLSEASKNKEILLTTTCKLLNYCIMIKNITINEFIINNKTTKIDIKYNGDIDHTSGLTFYVKEYERYIISINSKNISEYSINPPDITGSKSITINWKKLELPFF